MIEIFQTNVRSISEATLLSSQLQYRHHLKTVSFDLEDCDSVLRVESTHINPASIIQDLKASGFQCFVMPD